MSRKSISRRPLMVEKLEGRAMLAVNVSVSGGDLKVSGNNAADIIAIVQTGNKRFAVVGLDGTVVNGVVEGVVERSIKFDIRVDLKGGDDAAFIGNDIGGLIDIANAFGLVVPAFPDPGGLPGTFNCPDDLVVKTGSNDDVVALIGRVKDDLEIYTDGGNDLVSVRNTRVNSHAKIDSSSGADFLELINFSVDKELKVYLGSGDDNYFADNVDVFDDAYFDAGSGNDGRTTGTIQNSFIKDEFKGKLGTGDDDITFINNRGKKSTIDGESGVDFLFFDPNNLNDFRHYTLKSITAVELD